MDLVFGKEVISCVPKLKYIKSKNRGFNMSALVLLNYRVKSGNLGHQVNSDTHLQPV